MENFFLGNYSSKKLARVDYLILVTLSLYIALFGLFIRDFCCQVNLYFEQIYFFGLFSIHYQIPSIMISIFAVANVTLLYIILLRIRDKQLAFWGSLLYSISPWVAYLQAASSIYIFLLFCLLFCFFGALVINEAGSSYKDPKKLMGMLTILTGIVFSVYSSFFFFIIIPLLLLFFLKNHFLKIGQVKTISFLALILCIPLIFFSLIHSSSAKNLFKNQVDFSQQSLINNVNLFRKEANSTKLGMVSKIVENRFTYEFEQLVFVFLNQLTPVNYFSPQHGLFKFSFAPPIYVGLLIPFLLGLFYIDYSKLKLSTLLIFASLLLPSVVSKDTPDLEKLFLIFPVIAWITSLGIIEALRKKDRIFKIMKIIIISLIIFQIITLWSDIGLHESVRFTLNKNV